MGLKVILRSTSTPQIHMHALDPVSVIFPIDETQLPQQLWSYIIIAHCSCPFYVVFGNYYLWSNFCLLFGHSLKKDIEKFYIYRILNFHLHETEQNIRLKRIQMNLLTVSKIFHKIFLFAKVKQPLFLPEFYIANISPSSWSGINR